MDGAAAVDYLSGTGMAAIQAYEHELSAYALAQLQEVEGLILYGPPTAEGLTATSEPRGQRTIVMPAMAAAPASNAAAMARMRTRRVMIECGPGQKQ